MPFPSCPVSEASRAGRYPACICLCALLYHCSSQLLIVHLQTGTHLSNFEKNGTSVRRTKRRSLDTTAEHYTRSSDNTVITGCCAAAKSPTTGTTLVTKGRCRVRYICILSVEQSDLRCLHDIATGVSLSGLNQEVGFDI